MENHHFSWENPLLMAIFNSYVKLPEGNFGTSRRHRGRKKGRRLPTRFTPLGLMGPRFVSFDNIDAWYHYVPFLGLGMI